MRKEKKKKKAVVDPIQAALVKNFGATAVATLSEDRAEVTEFLPTGLSVLDREVLRTGGLPIGRAVEAFGGEGSGKTTLVAHLLAAALECGAVVTLVDSERSFQARRLRMVGGNPAHVTVVYPVSFEDSLQSIDVILSAAGSSPKRPMLVVWDSLASQATAGELAGSLGTGKRGKPGVGARARLMSDACRSWVQLLPRARACLVVINQTRAKINTGWSRGPQTTTPGGDALKFLASVRLDIRRVQLERDGTGQITSVRCVKNKLGSPWGRAAYLLRYTAGFDDDYAVRELAIEKKVVRAAGGFVHTEDERFPASQVESMAPSLRALLWPTEEMIL